MGVRGWSGSGMSGSYGPTEKVRNSEALAMLNKLPKLALVAMKMYFIIVTA
jgi:hypothetical protein